MVFNLIETKGTPSKNGTYLVKFRLYNRPEYDCIETAWREFKDGEWITPYFNHPNEASEIIGWYTEERQVKS